MKLRQELDQFGFATLQQCVSAEWVKVFRCELNSNEPNSDPLRRNLLTDLPVIRVFATEELLPLLRSVGAGLYFPVRALLFDKTPTANWKVAWHQDLSIAVAERSEAPGFTGWSLKAGVWHVQPPAALLERMVTIRLHLDDCGPDQGPLKIISGSHREGRLSHEQIEWWKKHGDIIECHVPVGGAVLMRPLLLHSSSPARQPSRRRVLHIEFASEPLPAGLRWAVEQPRLIEGRSSLLTQTAALS